jgi:hypothetical protein
MRSYTIRCVKTGDGFMATLLDDSRNTVEALECAGSNENEAIGRIVVWMLSSPNKCPFTLNRLVFN